MGVEEVEGYGVMDWRDKEPTESQIRSIKQHSTLVGIKKEVPETRGEAFGIIGRLHYLCDKKYEIDREKDDQILMLMSKWIKKRRKELKEEVRINHE